MRLRHLPVRLAVRGSDAEGAYAEFLVHGCVRDDFQMDRLAGKNGVVFFSNEFLIARVIRDARRWPYRLALSPAGSSKC